MTVIDLATGERFPVEGFTWPDDQYQDVLWESSPDGKRLLISGGEIGLKYEYIGVLDFEKMQYLEFARVNPNEVYEWKPYWFDKDTVIIQATSKDSYYVQDYYVYDLQASNPGMEISSTEKGIELIMPTDFDDFTALADRDYSDCSKVAAENAQLLEQVMVECGFKPYQGEWWQAEGFGTRLCTIVDTFNWDFK